MRNTKQSRIARFAIVVVFTILLIVSFGASNLHAGKKRPKPNPPLLNKEEIKVLMQTNPSQASEEIWRHGLYSRKPSSDLLDMASQLLNSNDTFTVALAEWAIASYVASKNSGVITKFPKSDPPDWYKTWAKIPASKYVEMDYVRQAVMIGIHKNSKDLLISGDKIVKSTHKVVNEINTISIPVEKKSAINKYLSILDAEYQKLANHITKSPNDLITARGLWLNVRSAARPIILAHSSINFNKIISVKIHNGHSLRNITGSQYPWTHKPGGDICMQHGLEPDSLLFKLITDRLGPGQQFSVKR